MNPVLVVLVFFLIIVLLLLVHLTYRVEALQHMHNEGETADEPDDAMRERLTRVRQYVYAGLVLTIVLLVALVYIVLLGTPWSGHAHEWLNLIVRWMHITFGIAWIGTSFYFVFLENALNRTKGLRDELAGNLWAVHGGGFYYLEKYKLAPQTIPKDLHWFKYEAYFTWLSGFTLLGIVYYLDAHSFLIDPRVMELTSGQAIGISVLSLIVGWLMYDWLCKSTLARSGPAFAIVGFALSILFAIIYTGLFSSRAAYIHFGALLGTLMAANVFFVIIPSQKAMVRAAKARTALDPQLGRHAGLRSLHNNYLTLPVLFVMISNHFPSTFGHDHPWAILAGLTLASVGVKHYLNLRERGQQSVWVLPLSILLLLAVAFVSAPQPKGGPCTSQVTITEVLNIVNDRCISCHSSRPTDDIWTSPPNGVVYDTPADIAKMKDKILQRVYYTETMPQNNKTNMTPEERDVLRCWVEQGAPIE